MTSCFQAKAGFYFIACILAIYSFTVITIESTSIEDVIKIMAYNMMRKHTKA